MILVQFEQTADPDSMRIFSDALEGPGGEPSGWRAPDAWLIGALLAIDGVSHVAIEHGFITVTRANASDAWVTLWPQIDRAMFTLI